MFQHTPFDGVVEINSVLLAAYYLEEQGGEWKVEIIMWQYKI